VDTAFVFNPAAGNFVLAGQGAGCLVGTMGSRRYQHTATLLGSGLVLLAGGTTDGSAANAVDTADLYDPAADCFAATGALKAKRFAHTATRLASGKVLLAGGTGTGGTPPLQSAELFDGTTFTTIAGLTQPTLTAARTQATATLLNSGKVLIAGGSGAANADLYDPTTNAGNGSFSSVTLQGTRSQHTARCWETGRSCWPEVQGPSIRPRPTTPP
jgi:succinyl-CoA synthetase alpha subunit